MIIWRPEGVLVNRPSRWENCKIDDGSSFFERRRRENSENGRIHVVESHRVDSREFPHVVFVRRVISVPADDVEAGMILLADELLALVLVENSEAPFFFDVKRSWIFEVSGIGKSIGADRTQIWQREAGAEDFANVAPTGSVNVHRVSGISS